MRLALASSSLGKRQRILPTHENGVSYPDARHQLRFKRSPRSGGNGRPGRPTSNPAFIASPQGLVYRSVPAIAESVQNTPWALDAAIRRR